MLQESKRALQHVPLDDVRRCSKLPGGSLTIDDHVCVRGCPLQRRRRCGKKKKKKCRSPPACTARPVLALKNASWQDWRADSLSSAARYHRACLDSWDVEARAVRVVMWPNGRRCVRPENNGTYVCLKRCTHAHTRARTHTLCSLCRGILGLTSGELCLALQRFTNTSCYSGSSGYTHTPHIRKKELFKRKRLVKPKWHFIAVLDLLFVTALQNLSCSCKSLSAICVKC